MIDISLAKKSGSVPTMSTPDWGAFRTYLLAGAHTTINLVDQATTNHLEKDDAGAGVEHLLVRRAVRLVFHVCV